MSQQCAEAMIETINRTTVCAYHVAATQYCETEVRAKCVKWLERRLTSETSVSLLKEIRWDITLITTFNVFSLRQKCVKESLHARVDRALLCM